MDRVIKEPVYLQICNILKGLIEEGEFQRGEKFLSEREVSSRFDVSRTTANKSLSSLVGEGILVYKKGIGTFVTEQMNSLSADIQQFIKKYDQMEYTIKVFCERPYDDLPEAIQSVFDREKNIYYIMAVYSLGEVPLLITRKYINSPLKIETGESFLDKDYFDYALFKKDISLSKLKKNDAPLLKREEGESLYLIRDELKQDESLIYDVTLLRSDCVGFTLDLDGSLKIQYSE